MTRKGLSGQSIYDIALQEYGDASGVAAVLSENPSLINNVDVSDVELSVSGDIINKRNVDEIFSEHRPVSN